MQRVVSWIFAGVLFSCVPLGCSSSRGDAPDADGTGGTPSGIGGASFGGGGAGGGCDPDVCVVGCGNGKIDPGLGEACDDGNDTPGDGCAADCKGIEKDYGCLEPGAACVNLVRCGDSKLMGKETCDDGNSRSGDGCSDACQLEEFWDCFRLGAACVPHCGDAVLMGDEECDPPNVGQGCSATCRLESGYACEPPDAPDPATPARCHRTVCGDGKREGQEACDDSNDVDGDGCSGGCALEPECSEGTCTSLCGDGIQLAPEGCDDGNAEAGDGCSDTCEREPGFSCEPSATSLPEQLNLAVRYRDFISFPINGATRHPDFEAVWEGQDVSPGLLKPTLNAQGKPELDGRCSEAQPATIADAALCPYGQMLSIAANAAAWYADAAGVNVPVPGALSLARGAGGAYEFDSGGTGFYPIDGRGFLAAPARETTELADAVINDGGPHNFGFTTELRYFFQYRGGESLTFSGDDDLWVFVNRRLALDVGGLHTRLARTLEVDDVAAALGLVEGGLYEIALFHAERHSAGSNFHLTLTGFVPSRSLCRSTCGDGVVAGDEQCDLGRERNTGGYEGCTEDCQRGLFCGDAVVQSADEACDDGLNVTPYELAGNQGCAPGCVRSGFCGDGKLDSLFGEQCDPGMDAGMANGCAPDCRLGARCGDGTLQRDLGESCDDGNTLSSDGCSHTCQIEVR